MDDLIEALTIMRKYTDTNFPTNCVHDELEVDLAPELVSEEDIKRLDELGFFESGEQSFKFGSC